MIGILDSGVGGLSVFKEIVRLMPNQHITYIADTANCPYGPLNKQTILTLTRKMVHKLVNLKCDIIVFACNTMTAAAAAELRSEFTSVRIVGMEPAVKPAARISRTKVIGVLATQATLGGELYRYTKKKYASDVEVIEIAGRGLVEVVENETQNSPEAMALIRNYIEPLIQKGADTLVLGCTHFPFLTEQINEIAKGQLHLIDPAPAVARQTKKLADKMGLTATGEPQPEYTFISTGNADDQLRLEKMAEQILQHR